MIELIAPDMLTTGRLIDMVNNRFDRKRVFSISDAEQALFYHFLSQSVKDEDFERRRDLCLEEIMQVLPVSANAGSYLCQHLFAFNCLASIVKSLSEDTENNGATHPFVARFRHWHQQWIHTAAWQSYASDIGYLQGLTGILHYLLTLPAHFTGKEQLQWVENEMVRKLAQFSREGLIHTASGFTETGLADGISGMLLVLIKLAQQRGLGEADPLFRWIKDSMRQLIGLRQQVDQTEDKCSFFPYQVNNRERLVLYDNRLNWNNSDLAYALIFHRAGKLLKDNSYARVAKIVALNTLLRITVPHTGITGATVQDGSAGLAILYRELANEMRLPVLNTGYHFWLEQVMQLSEMEMEELSEHNESDILNGLTGITLTLSGYGEGMGTGWKHILLF